MKMGGAAIRLHVQRASRFSNLLGEVALLIRLRLLQL